MEYNKNTLIAILAVLLIVSSSALIFFVVEENVPKDDTVYPQPLHGTMNQSFLLTYEGMSDDGLNRINDRYRGNGTHGGCTISFANYDNGQTGAIRNYDLYNTESGIFNCITMPGHNVKYTTVGLSYSASGDPFTADEIRENGMPRWRYDMVNLQSTDNMSCGTDKNGQTSCLYTATFMREYEPEHPEWQSKQTYPNAPITACVTTIAALLAMNACTVEEALQAVGAVGEDGKKYYEDESKIMFNVFAMNLPSYKWTIGVSLIDSYGNCGVLEFVENKCIFVPAQIKTAMTNLTEMDMKYDNSVIANFYMAKEYLLNDASQNIYDGRNEDGTMKLDGSNKYKEKYMTGISRYAIVRDYIEQVHNETQHQELMDSVNYRVFSHYNCPVGYVGYDVGWGKERPLPIDWRGEMTVNDMFATKFYFETVGIDMNKADAYKPLGTAHYKNTLTGQIVEITYQDWKDDFVANDYQYSNYQMVYDGNTVFLNEYKDEIQRQLEWYGYLRGHSSLQDELLTGSWYTALRTVANPATGAITFWYFEDENYKDGYNVIDIAKNGIKTDSSSDSTFSVFGNTLEFAVATVKN